MSVQIINNTDTGECCYEYTHKSGIRISVIPKPQFSSAAAYFGTKYGSIDTAFKIDENADYTVVPEGIAHYLEHKLFENEDCDAFERFSQTGAYANAYTSFDQTCYLFSCSNNFYDSLKILLDFVQDPYFTPETVQKEQGIIGQEISMYDDDPNWSVLFNLLRCLYKNHPVRIDIAGTVESIAQITPELLYSCYNTFYNLSNMFICIAGNVEPQKVFDICDEMLKDKPPVKIIRKPVDEPLEVVCRYTEHNLPVAAPLFAIGYKEAVMGEKTLDERVAADFIRMMLFANDSPLYKKLLDSKLINDNFSTEYFGGFGYAATLIQGESAEPQKVKDEIDAYLQNVAETGLDEKAFNRVKKAMLGFAISAYDEPLEIPRLMVDAAVGGYGVFDVISSIKSMTFDYASKRFYEMFNTERSALSVVKAK